MCRFGGEPGQVSPYTSDARMESRSEPRDHPFYHYSRRVVNICFAIAIFVFLRTIAGIPPGPGTDFSLSWSVALIVSFSFTSISDF